MNKEIRKYLEEKGLTRLLGIKEPYEIDFLAQGEYNRNFLIRGANRTSFVFRLNYGSQLGLENQISYEYQALKRLEESKSTPQVYYLDDKKEFFSQGLLIMEFLPGRPLNYKTDLPEAAKLLGKIHRLELSEEDEKNFICEKSNILDARVNECRKLLESVFDSSFIDLKTKVLLDEALNDCQKHLDQQKFFIEQGLWSICNTELNSHNFIIAKNSYVIDWEKPVISHPVQDISQFLASTTTLWRENICLSQAEKREFLRDYLILSQIEKSDFLEALKIYHPYLMLRALSWSAMAYDSYRRSEKALQNQEIFAKVKSYLDSDFLSQALKEQVLRDE